ncbi:MAG: ScyD/ScyE family protein [Dehalococcoidia bacterium]|nr:ScyD/ScyE family protein [Dehalococcoidia bacterium]
MRTTRPLSRMRRALLGATTLFLLGGLVASAQPAPPGEVVAAGLDHPRGLTADGDDVLIAELGAGRVLRLAPDGSTSVLATGLPTTVFFNAASGSDEPGGPSAVVPVAGGYAVAVSEADTGAFQSVYYVQADGTQVRIADLGAYEAEHNTDGDTTPDGDPELLSNPYSIVTDGAGGLYVADSGANAVLHISADGTVSPFAVFPDRENPLFPDFGPPTMDQVPTGMVAGPDGALYVTTLTGFPFPQGGAVVYRLSDDDGNGDALGDGEMTVFASGLTAATDLAFDVDGSLLVTQFTADMLAENVPGQVVRVRDGDVQVVVDGLITPTNLVVTASGRVLVSQAFAGLVSDVTDLVRATPEDGSEGAPADDTEDSGATPESGTPAPAASGHGALIASGGSMSAVWLALAVAVGLVALRGVVSRSERA